MAKDSAARIVDLLTINIVGSYDKLFVNDKLNANTRSYPRVA